MMLQAVPHHISSFIVQILWTIRKFKNKKLSEKLNKPNIKILFQKILEYWLFRPVSWEII